MKSPRKDLESIAGIVKRDGRTDEKELKMMETEERDRYTPDILPVAIALVSESKTQ
jgi:hypothetical protein